MNTYLLGGPRHGTFVDHSGPYLHVPIPRLADVSTFAPEIPEPVHTSDDVAEYVRRRVRLPGWRVNLAVFVSRELDRLEGPPVGLTYPGGVVGVELPRCFLPRPLWCECGLSIAVPPRSMLHRPHCSLSAVNLP